MLEEIAARRTLRAAFERVRENGGCRGADGVTVGGFAASLESELDRLERSLLDRRYRPLPLLRFPVAKRNGGVRWLSVPTVRDRVAQTAVHLVIQDVVEAELEESSYAFRRGRSVRDAIHRVRELRDQGFRWVVDADVDACFDSIAHPLLSARLARLPLPVEVLELLERWVRAEVWDGDRVSRLERGVPQGSVVSPALANLVLDELDEHFALFGRATVRYADDFLVLCRRREEAEAAVELTEYLLAELELTLNREKTRTTSFDDGFTFLGVVFLKDAILVPFDRPEPEGSSPVLPPPLDLVAYLEHGGGG